MIRVKRWVQVRKNGRWLRPPDVLLIEEVLTYEDFIKSFPIASDGGSAEDFKPMKVLVDGFNRRRRTIYEFSYVEGDKE